MKLRRLRHRFPKWYDNRFVRYTELKKRTGLIDGTIGTLYRCRFITSPVI